MIVAQFYVPGEPVAKGRGRAAVVNGRAHVFTPSRTRNYENLVKLAAKQAVGERVPVEQSIAVSIAVLVQIPASMSKKDRQAALDGVLHPAKKPDLSNVAKAVEDGMNGVVYADDKYICDLHLSKRYAVTPGVRVIVETLA